jgi:hypothetical protein
MKFKSLVSLAVLGVVLAGCNADFDGTLKVATPFSLTRPDSSTVNVSVNQSGTVTLSDKVEDDGTYRYALVLNGQKFYFSVPKENVDPSNNHAQADANATTQNIGLDALITPNTPVSSNVSNSNQFCPMTSNCWHIVSQQTTVNGTTTTAYVWNYSYDSGCPGMQSVQTETDYVADQLNVRFSDPSGKTVATFSGFGEQSSSEKVLGKSECVLNDHYTSSDFRPNYQPNGPYDYR